MSTKKAAVSKAPVSIQVGPRRFIIFAASVAASELYNSGQVPAHRVLELNGVLVPNDGTDIPISDGNVFAFVSPLVHVTVHPIVDGVADPNGKTVEIESETTGSALYAAAGAKPGQLILRASGEVIEPTDHVNVGEEEALGIF